MGIAALLLLAPRLLLIELASLDEVWVFQFSRRILHGFTPYRDFFLVVPPLSFQINAGFLRVFGDEMIVLRAVALLVASVNTVVLHAVARRMGVPRLLALFPPVFFLLAVYSRPYNSYTWFALLFLCLALLGEVKILDSVRERGTASKRTLFGVGAWIGLTILAKQHIGVAAMVASATLTMLVAPGSSRRGTAFRHLGWKFSGVAAVVGAEVLYLMWCGALGGFVRESILGAWTFGREATTPYGDLFSGPAIIPAVLVPLGLVILLGRGIQRGGDVGSRFVLIALYAAGNFLLVVPRVDATYLLRAIPVSVIGMVLVVERLLNTRHARWSQKAVLAVPLLILLVPLLNLGWSTVELVRNRVLEYSSVKHYAWIPQAPSFARNHAEVVRRIQNEEQLERRVYFLDFRAAAHLIPMDRFADRFDCTLAGNFGPDGLRALIEEISRNRDATVLFSPGSHPLEPAALRGFVETEMKRVGEVAAFGIYRFE